MLGSINRGIPPGLATFMPDPLAISSIREAITALLGEGYPKVERAAQALAARGSHEGMKVEVRQNLSELLRLGRGNVQPRWPLLHQPGRPSPSTATGSCWLFTR